MEFIKNNYLKLIIILAIVGVGFWLIKSRTSTTDPNTYQSNTDKIVSPKKQEIVDELTLAGSIDSQAVATLRFQSSGQLTWLGVKVGDSVKKWQTLALIDRKELEKQLQLSLNNYLTNRSTFEDTQDDYKSTKEKYLLTDEIKRILDRTQYSLNNSVINYELSSLALRYSSLVSPINGVVTAIDQNNAGVNINPTNFSITVIDPNTIFFKSEIDQETVPKISLGQKAVIKLDSFPEQTIDSEVTYISFVPVAGQTSTVYQLKFLLPLSNSDMTYRLGMDGDVSLILAKSDQNLTLPTDSINSDDKGTYVLQKNSQNKLTKTYIKTGIETDTLNEILEGITENDQVVIKKRSR